MPKYLAVSVGYVVRLVLLQDRFVSEITSYVSDENTCILETGMKQRVLTF